MPIIDTINTARSRGADDTDILREIGIQNPNKLDSFNTAIGRGATPTMILNEIYKQNSSGRVQTEPEKLNFGKRVYEDIKKRAVVAEEISRATAEGEQSYAEGMLQVAGKVGVGGLFDLLGQGLVSAARGLSAITPDVIENPIKDLAKSAGAAFLNTEIGQRGLAALELGMEEYEHWKAGNPRSARNVEAIIDIGLLVAPVKAKPKAKPTAIGTFGTKIGERSVAQTEAAKQKFVQSLVSPEQTKAVREAQVGRVTEVGILKSKKVAPSFLEAAAAKEVAKIPGVSSRKTLQGNFNVINKATINAAKDLEAAVAKHDFVYPKKQLLSELRIAGARLSESPTIVGDAEKTAQRLIAKFKQFIDEQPGTGSGVLKARKKYDAWVKGEKPKAFDAKAENAFTIANREVRNVANDFLERGAKDVGVKESLRRQHNLYNAMNNIAPKAAGEASNIVMRGWQNVLRVLPFRGEFNQIMATLFAVGGLGASALFAPYFTKLVLASLFTYGAGRVIFGANTKKILSTLLRGIDQAIRKTKDANLIRELRADRAAILELLELVKQEEAE